MRRLARVGLFLLLTSLGCRDRDPARAGAAAASPSASGASTAPATPLFTRRGGMDVTFVVVSDTHVGYLYPSDLSKLSASAIAEPVGLEKDNARLITRVNGLAGHAYPPALGGKVAPPRGLVVTGDLTEWGRVEEWGRFVELFGLQGTEGALKIPVFEMIGNHDTVNKGPWVGEQVAARHGGRFYSWNWDDLHLVALGEAPNDEGLAFLARDLERVAPDVPVAVFFHRALSGPWSTDNWFDDGLKERLARALTGHAVAAIFHGHHHATGHYVWRGMDVWKPGAVKDDAHTFAVVHVTDTTWTLASYNWETKSWASTFVKALSPPADRAAARRDE